MPNDLIIQNQQPSVLVSREKPLTPDDYDSLEKLIDKSFTIEVPCREVTVPVQDELGHIARWERELVYSDAIARPKGEPDMRLLEAVRRPAGPGHIVAHLTRLAAHLRHTKGDEAWQIMLEDVARHINGVSEWAIVKTCAELREGDIPFFPDTPSLIAKVRKWDRLAQLMGKPDKAKPKKIEEKAWVKPTPEQRARVSKIMHESGLHLGHEGKHAEYCEDCKKELQKQGVVHDGEV